MVNDDDDDVPDHLFTHLSYHVQGRQKRWVDHKLEIAIQTL